MGRRKKRKGKLEAGRSERMRKQIQQEELLKTIAGRDKKAGPIYQVCISVANGTLWPVYSQIWGVWSI